MKWILRGQYWPEGDASFHRRLNQPTLLLYGMRDPFISLIEQCEMEKVSILVHQRWAKIL